MWCCWDLSYHVKQQWQETDYSREPTGRRAEVSASLSTSTDWKVVQNHSLPKQSLILLIFYLTYLMFSRNICCFFYKKMINAISIAIDNLLLHPWLKKMHMRDKNDFKDTDLTKGEHWGNSWFSPKVEFKLRCSLISYSFLLLNSPCDINRVWRVRQCRWGPLTTTLWIRRRRFYSWLDHR